MNYYKYKEKPEFVEKKKKHFQKWYSKPENKPVAWNKGKKIWPKGRPELQKWRHKLGAPKGRVPWNKGKHHAVKENNPAWKGGISTPLMLLRSTPEYKQWRKDVLKRDGNICQICKKTKEKMDVDHIKSFRYFPKLRHDINNGRVLCKECHRATPNYKNRKHAI